VSGKAGKDHLAAFLRGRHYFRGTSTHAGIIINRDTLTAIQVEVESDLADSAKEKLKTLASDDCWAVLKP